MLDILANYGPISGQYVNRGKTSPFFSKSTFDETKLEIKNSLDVPKIVHYDKYLRLSYKRKRVLITSKKKYGGNFKVGKRSYYHRQVEKC